MILNPAARVRILSGSQSTMRLRSPHKAYPNLRFSKVVHWVPEQLNMMAVTGTCKLIDGCSLALCSATVLMVSAGIYATKIKSNPLHDSIVMALPWDIIIFNVIILKIIIFIENISLYYTGYHYFTGLPGLPGSIREKSNCHGWHRQRKKA